MGRGGARLEGLLEVGADALADPLESERERERGPRLEGLLEVGADALADPLGGVDGRLEEAPVRAVLPRRRPRGAPRL